MKTESYTIARPDTGAVLPYASVTVFRADGTTKATIYNAAGTDTVPNPITATIAGAITFAAPNGTYVLSAVSADGNYSVPPITVDIFDLDALATAIATVGITSIVTKKYATKSARDADLTPAAGTICIVYGDSTATNNDLSYKIGASGSGSWSAPLGLMAGLAQTYSLSAQVAAQRATTALGFTSWSALNAVSGVQAGDRSFVSASDTGTHTDPVVGGTVTNGGRYSWSASPAGWQRIGDLDSQTAKGFSDAAASAATSAAGMDAIERAFPINRNLIQRDRLISNAALRVSDGAVVSGISGFFVTDLIRLPSSGSFYTVNALYGNTTYGYVYFGADGTTRIGGSGAGVSAGSTISSFPSGAVYVRFTLSTAQLISAHLVAGSSAPSAFRNGTVEDQYSVVQSVINSVTRWLRPAVNLYLPDFRTQGKFLNAGTGAETDDANSFITNYFAVKGNTQYVSSRTIFSVAWYNLQGDQISVSGAVTAGTPFTSPVNAVTCRASYNNAAAAGAGQAFGSNEANAWSTLEIVEGTTVPSGFVGGGVISPERADRIARTARGRFGIAVANQYIRSASEAGKYISPNGNKTTLAANLITNPIPVYPGLGLVINFDVTVAQAFGWMWYDRDDNRLAAAVLTANATVASGGTVVTINSVSAGLVLQGLPIAMTGIPARSYIGTQVSGTPGGAGVYNLMAAAGGSATATADNTGTLSGGGALANIPLFPPDGVSHGRISLLTSNAHEYVITYQVLGTNDIVLGWEDLANSKPWAGANYMSCGDSNENDATGNNAMFLGVARRIRANPFLKNAGSGRKMQDCTTGITSASVAGVDLCKVALGGADFSVGGGSTAGTPIGSDADSSGTASFWGYMKREILDNLQTWNPTMRIVMTTPTPQFDNSFTTNNQGASMRDYCEAMIAFGKAYGIPVFDFNAQCGLNRANVATVGTSGASTYMTDNRHWNLTGHVKRATPLIAGFLDRIGRNV